MAAPIPVVNIVQSMASPSDRLASLPCCPGGARMAAVRVVRGGIGLTSGAVTQVRLISISDALRCSKR